MVKNKTVFLAGASARAAAMSAQRAGWNPIASDLFGDRDLSEPFPFYPVSRYPDDFSIILRKLQKEFGKPIPVMYTGALENYPELLEELEKQGILLGNPSRVVRKVRNPFELVRLLSENGLPAVPVSRNLPDVVRDRKFGIRWLKKPYRSSGGNRIQFQDSPHPSAEPSSEFYYQKYIEGESLSAILVSDQDRVDLLGITRQLTGVEELNARPFAYSGSEGPIRLRSSAESVIRKIGRLIASRFQLRGLFGLDLIDDGENVWLIEVNPRYTASVEVIEIAYETSFFNWHWNCFAREHSGLDLIPCDPPKDWDQLELRNEVSKLILYAKEDLIFPENIPLELPLGYQADCLESQSIVIADVPKPGTEVKKGQPVCTFLSPDRDVMERVAQFQKELNSALSPVNATEKETPEC